MARQAHHHFIPSSYLKGFTEEGKDTSQFWCVPINNDEPFLTRPKDACSQRDYYTVAHEDSLIVEKWYANEIEPRINIALRHIDETTKLPSGEDIQNLLLLAATHYLRVPAFRSTIESSLLQAKEIAESMSCDMKISNLSDFEYTKTDLIEMEIRHIQTIFELLKNKYYRLYNASNSAFDFVTSDHPFGLIHPNDRDKKFYFGLNTPGIQICIPINRNIILIGQNEPFREGTLSADDRLIAIMNKILIEGAGRFFYSSKSEIPVVDDENNVCKHAILSNKVS
jgi:hypothetical protein